MVRGPASSTVPTVDGLEPADADATAFASSFTTATGRATLVDADSVGNGAIRAVSRVSTLDNNEFADDEIAPAGSGGAA